MSKKTWYRWQESDYTGGSKNCPNCDFYHSNEFDRQDVDADDFSEGVCVKELSDKPPQTNSYRTCRFFRKSDDAKFTSSEWRDPESYEDDIFS